MGVALRLISYVLSVVFTFHNVALAYSGAEDLHFPERAIFLETAVKKFNSLTKDQIKEELLNFQATLSPEDRNFLKNKVGDLSEVSFPKLRVRDDHFAFTFEEREYSILPFTESTMLFQGNLIEFKPGRFQESIDNIEQMLNDKGSLTFIDFIIQPAYADNLASFAKGVGVTGMVIAAFQILVMICFGAAGAVFVVPALIGFGALALYNWGNTRQMGDDRISSMCRIMKSQINEKLISGAEADRRDALMMVNKMSRSLKTDRRCASDTSASRQKKCAIARTCLNDLQNDLGMQPAAVNSSSRNQSKDQRTPSSSTSRQTSTLPQ